MMQATNHRVPLSLIVERNVDDSKRALVRDLLLPW